MSLLGLLARRVAMGALAAWAILSIVFALFTLTDEWVLRQDLARMRWGGSEEEVLQAVQQDYLAARGIDQPFWQNYVDWMGNMLLLEWGDSFLTGEPALDRVVDAVIATGTYIVPAIVIAMVLGIAIGLYAALNQNSPVANTGIGLTYLLFAVPSFWIGGILLSLTITQVIGHSQLVFKFLLPVVLTTLALLGGYVSYARAHALEYASTDFVKLVKAKGGGRLRLAKHVARNSAIPFFSMLFSEALALLVLAVFVLEVLFGIEGFGLLLFESINERDLPVLLGGTIVIIAVGVVGNIIQDVSYSLLDPRVDTGTR